MTDSDRAPTEVVAMADRWAGGHGVQTLDERMPGVWHCSAEDGMRYVICRPGVQFPVYEDSGRPAGYITEPDLWLVRCSTDAPDAWWSVSTNGYYNDWYGGRHKLW